MNTLPIKVPITLNFMECRQSSDDNIEKCDQPI